MISKKLKANFFLGAIILLIIVTYSYNIIQNRGSIDTDMSMNINENNSLNLTNGVTKFFDVEYKINTSRNKEFVTKGKEALISNNNPDQILLSNVNSYIVLNDGSILNINSDKAEYEKKSKNIKYYQNVIIKNKNNKITAKVANFYANKNLIRLQDFIYKDEKNLIKGDIADLNTITSDLLMSMKQKEDQVYGRRK